MNRYSQRLTVLALALFTITATLRAEVGDEHLVMGNPSNATTDTSKPTNYLMRKAEYVLSYNKSTSCPNWVSWHLNASWIGTADRQNNFRPDTSLPNGWLQIKPNDYTKTGFDRGHMCNSKDRSKDVEANSMTFLMTNMVPQSKRNNEHTWEGLESFCRVLAQDHELYIICGPNGQGGTGQNGERDTIDAVRNDGTSGTITVPATTWKVVLVLPSGNTAPSDVSSDTATIAVNVPNEENISDDWKQYIVTINDVEKLTGYTFFSTVAPQTATIIKAKKYTP